jgi:hypothetical protein
MIKPCQILFFWLSVVLIPLELGGQETRLDESNSWTFEQGDDPFEDSALLDLRYLNETTSGQNGFIRLSPDGNGFIRGDGKPIRFWMVGTDAYRFTPEQMDEHARWLAKLGVNMCRLHVTVCDNSEGAKITDLNEEIIDGVFRFIQSAKQNGIYVTISPFYAHFDAPASWDLPGGKIDMEGIIFLDEKLQAAYREWTRQLYTRVNPHTGLAIKDDPTVALLQVHNEDSLFFWTAQSLPEHYRSVLAQEFEGWLTEKYGSVELAIDSWGHDAREFDPLDDFAKGKIGCLRIYDLTINSDDWLEKRRNDTAQFLAEFQQNFYRQMGDFLRDELKCRQLLNATNWRTANDEKLKALERYSYHALDVDAENEYVGSDYQHIGRNSNYRIDPGHYLVNESVLGKPFEMCTNFIQESGHPFILTETAWKNPNRYQSEGPFLVAAYQSLNGIDAVAWFSCQTPRYESDPLKSFWRVGDQFSTHKWNHCYPAMMSGFPANALLYRRNYLQEAVPIVQIDRNLEDVFARKPGPINDNEAYGDQRNQPELQPDWQSTDGRINRVAFQIGPVVSRTGGLPAKVDIGRIDKYFDPNQGTITSSTGQLVWNYRKQICQMNAPLAQGVTGFLNQAGGRFDFLDLKIESSNEYATINLVSLDGDPIAESNKLLLQVVTVNRLSGYETKPAKFRVGEGDNGYEVEGEQIVRIGKPPYRIADTQVTVNFKSKRFQKATLLDWNGYAKSEMTIDNGQLKLPHDCVYAVIEP